MFRRSKSPNRLRIESLEARCNLSAIAPMGDAPAEPAAEVGRAATTFFAFPGFSGGVTVAAADSLPIGGGVDILIADTGGDRADDNGHGAHVAGTIGTVENGSPVGKLTGTAVQAHDDVIVDGRIITAQDYDTAAQPFNSAGARLGFNDDISDSAATSADSVARHEVGHALGFYHEHTRPSGSGGDNVLIGGLTTYEQADTIANSGYIRIKKLNSGG